MFLYKQHTEFVGTRRVQSGVRLSFKRSFRHCVSLPWRSVHKYVLTGRRNASTI